MASNFTPQEIEQFLQEFFDTVGARQYIGARYVPIFGRAGEETMEWDDVAPYEPLTVVMHDGVSFVSRRYVPTGIDITDTTYWVETYRFNAQVEQYRQEVLSFQDQINDRTPFPVPPAHSRYGTAGQVLSTLGDGTTEWADPVVPSAEQAEAVITQWLDDHPEATTTVLDNSITTAKLVDGSVTDAKLAPTGLILRTDEFIAGFVRPSLTAGGYYDRTTGEIVERAGFSYTGMLPCAFLEDLIIKVDLNDSSDLNWFFDANQEPISKFTIYSGTNSIEVPEGAVWYGLSGTGGYMGTVSVQVYPLNFVNDYDHLAQQTEDAITDIREAVQNKASNIMQTEIGTIVSVDTDPYSYADLTIGQTGQMYKSSRNMLNPREHVIYSDGQYGLGGATQDAAGDYHIGAGTTTATLFFRNWSNQSGYQNGFQYMPAGTYMISVVDATNDLKPTGVYMLGLQWYYVSDTATSQQEEHRIDRSIDNNFFPVTLTEAAYVKPYFQILSGTTISDMTVRMQLELGTERHTAVPCSFETLTGTSARANVDTDFSCFWSNVGAIAVRYSINLKDYIDEHSGSDIRALEARVDDHETRLDADELTLSQNTSDIATLQTSKVNVTQAVADSGKYLCIGSDGRVYPATVGTPTPEQVSEIVTDWLDEHPGVTMHYDTLTGEVGVINPTYPWGDVRRYGIFPDGVTNWQTTPYIPNAIANSATLGLELYWPQGYYASQCLIMTSNVTMRFEEGAEFGGLVHVVSHRSQDPQSADQNPLENIRLKGCVTTYGRYGQTDARNVWIDRIHLKADSTKDIDNHINGRGAHIYWGNDGFWCDEIVVDNCDNAMATLDAAIAIDGFGNNPKNFHIGKIHIKDSKVHGLYLTGSGHWIGEVVVDAFGSDKLNDANPGLQDSNGVAQSRELCGVWLNRVQDTFIGKISVNQDVVDERPNARYSVRIDETGVNAFGAVKIGEITALNVRNNNRGVTFGDVSYAAPRCLSDVGLILINADNLTGAAGYGLLTLAAESAVNVNSLFENGRGVRPAVDNRSSVSQVGMQVIA